MRSNVETEIKLVTASGQTLKELFTLDFIRRRICSEITVNQLESRYYDTPKRRFAKAGIVFRVRKHPGGFAATAKLENKNSGGLSERLEYTVDQPFAQPDFTQFDKVNFLFDLSALMEKEGRVEELFSVLVERRQCELAVSGDTTVEMAVDLGKIIAGDKTVPIAEVEFEIIKGKTGDLLEFIAELAKLRPFFSEWRSKYYQGCELAGEKTEGPRERWPELKNPLKNSLLSALLTFTGRALTALTRAALAPDKKTFAGLGAQVYQLRQFLFLGQALLEPVGYALYDKKLAALQDKLQEASLLSGFAKRWRRLETDLLIDNPDAFGKLLLDKNARVKESLGRHLRDGQPGADIFALWAWLAGEPWKDNVHTDISDYIEEQGRYIKRELGRLDADHHSRRLSFMAETLLYMLRYQSKTGSLNKSRKNLNLCLTMLSAKAKLAVIGENLFGAFRPSASRLTYRDAGILYGSYWRELTVDSAEITELLDKIAIARDREENNAGE